MSEDIEKVSRAICEDERIDPDGETEGNVNWTMFQSMARAAITAYEEARGGWQDRAAVLEEAAKVAESHEEEAARARSYAFALDDREEAWQYHAKREVSQAIAAAIRTLKSAPPTPTQEDDHPSRGENL